MVEQEVFWQREQGLQILSELFVHGLDKNKPSEQLDPQGEQMSRSLRTHRLVRPGSFRTLALKANSSLPHDLAMQRPGLHNSKGGSKLGLGEAPENQQSSTRSTSLIPHTEKSEEAIAENPEPFGICDEL